MKRLIIALLLILPVSFLAQTDREIARELAQNQAKEKIIQMKSGVLLVRLYDKSNVVNALKEKGMEKRAEAIIKKQKAINMEIAASFKNFNFCKVYFFYSGHSEHLINGELNKVELYEDDLILAKDQKLTSNFVVADFGMMNGDQETKTETKQKPKSGISEDKTYKGSTNTFTIKAMYLRNNDLMQMERPFPYFVRFHPTPINNRSYEDVVKIMNKRLNEFYLVSKK